MQRTIAQLVYPPFYVKLWRPKIKDATMKFLFENSLLFWLSIWKIYGYSTAQFFRRQSRDDRQWWGGVLDTWMKLKAHGISGEMLNWIKAFLTDRKQVVRVTGEHSKSASVISGVPQVSILGPLLFLIFINDLPDHVNFLVYLFADNTK